MKADKMIFKDKFEAMSNAVSETISSVLGSSLTTFAGFLALCTMTLTLGTDIGLVMSKGVLFGVICVMTMFPCFILLWDKVIEKTKHRVLLPQFKLLQRFVLNRRVLILIIFGVLLIPILYGNFNYKVYYKLDESLPNNLPYKVSTKDLKEKFTSLYTAFQYGAPPHAGMAPGIDRMLMLLKEEENIREVIAFPMNSNAQDLLVGSPNEVSEQQLREVHIKLR